MKNQLNRHRGLGRLGLGLGLVALLVAGWTTQASATCLAPPGDVNGNGNTDVTDAQCAFLGTLWQINIANGVPASQPTCAGTSILRADVNCDNSITVSDATIVVSLALGLELDSSIDANGDLCVDVCEGATASCGNGIQEFGEECDDGFANSDILADFCRTTCVLPECGDGVVDTGESCDDGNAIDGDGCQIDCSNTAGAAFPLPYIQSFDSGTFGSIGWTVESDLTSGSNNFGLSSLGPLGPDAHARIFAQPFVSNYTDRIVSPLIDASASGFLTLSFEQAISLAGAGADTVLKAQVSANGGADWIDVWTRTGADPEFSGNTVVDVSSAIGGSSEARLAFEISGPSTEQIVFWEVDQVELRNGAPPVLASVQNITVAVASTAQVTISATDLDTASGNLSFSLTNNPAFVSMVDNGDGTATITASPNAAQAGAYPDLQIAVTDGDFNVTDTFNVTAVAGAAGTPAAVLIRNAAGGGGIELADLTVEVGNTLTLYAATYNAFGDYLFDTPVTWSATNSLEAPPAGPASTVVFAPTTPETSGQIVATPADGSVAPDSTGTISVIPPSGSGPDLVASTVDVFPPSIEAGSAETATVTVTVVDTFGNPVEGATVVLSATAGTLVGSVVEQGDGLYTQLIEADANIGSGTITATVNANALNDSASIGFVDFLTIETTTTIDCDNYSPTYENKDLLVKASLTINTNPTALDLDGCDGLLFGDIIVQSGGTITHGDTTTAQEYRTDIEVDSLVIQTGGQVNVSGLGYKGRAWNQGNAYSIGNVTTTGSERGAGGSHGGLGGEYNSNQDAGPVFDNYKNPRELGGGGGGRLDCNCSGAGGDGGGVFRVVASSQVVVDGTLNASGVSASSASGGAGGSIYIQTPTLTGSGSVLANGGNGQGNNGGGGGGRIAIVGVTNLGGDYSIANFPTNVRAYGGVANNGEEGGAGTIFLQRTSDTYGALLIDNNNHDPGVDSTPFMLLPQAESADITGSELTVSGLTLESDWYVGTWINPNIAQPNAGQSPSSQQFFEITEHTDSVLTLSGAPTVATTGDTYKGVLLLDHLDIRGLAETHFDGDVIVLGGNLFGGDEDTYELNATLKVETFEFDGIDAISLTSANLNAEALFTGGVSNARYDWTLTSSTVTASEILADTYSATNSTVNLTGDLDVTGALYASGGTHNVGGAIADEIQLINANGTYGSLQSNNDLYLESTTATVGTVDAGRDFILELDSVVTINEDTVNADRRVHVRGTANLTHEITDRDTPIRRLHITAQSVIVDALAKLNTDQKGFRGYWTSGSSAPRTIGNSTTNSAPIGWGGSHGGLGGDDATTTAMNSIYAYGSAFQPIHPGAGGGRRGNANSNGGHGGGAIRIEGSTLVRVDGTISANGIQSHTGGAGGSIWITTPYLAGDGLITANGGNGSGVSVGGPGGGGRIAFDGLQLRTGAFSDAQIVDNVRAWGGNGSNSMDAGAGTVFIKHDNQEFGDLLIANSASNNQVRDESTPFVLVPEGISGDNEGAILFDGSAGWDDDRYAGTYVNPNIEQAGGTTSLVDHELFYITNNTPTELTVAGEVPLNDIAPDQNTYRGILPVDRLEIRQYARVNVEGDLLVLFGDITSPGGETMTLRGTVTANIIDLNEVDTIVMESGGLGANVLATQGGTASLNFVLDAASQLDLPDLNAGSFSSTGATVEVGDMQVIGDLILSSTNLTTDNLTVLGDGDFTNCTINALDLNADNLVVRGGTTTVERLLIDDDIDLLEGATVTINNATVSAGGDMRILDNNTNLKHCDTSPTQVCELNLAVGSLLIGDGATINVDYLGFDGGVNGTNLGYTLGNMPTGAAIRHGGSHGGVGGGSNANLVYDSIYDPIHPGAGGARGNSSSWQGGAGGGVIRIAATDFVVINGTLTADGLNQNGGGGAGGSINITTPVLGGSGTVGANGGNGRTDGNSNGSGGGGGGRIAFKGMTAVSGSFAVPSLFTQVRAYGGNGTTWTGNSTHPWRGGAGTIYLQRNGQSFGDLLVDNNGQDSYQDSTPLPVIPEGPITNLVDDFIFTDTGADFPEGLFVGSRVNPNVNQPNAFSGLKNQALYLVVGHTSDTLTVAGASPVGNVAPVGSTYRGVLAFDNFEIRGGARVFVDGDVLVESGDLASGDDTTWASAGTLNANIIDLNLVDSLQLDGGGLEAAQLFSHGEDDYSFDIVLNGGTLDIPDITAEDLVAVGGTVTTNSLTVSQNLDLQSSANFTTGTTDITGDLLVDGATFNCDALSVDGIIDWTSATVNAGAVTAGTSLQQFAGSATLDSLNATGEVTLDGDAQMFIENRSVTTADILRVLGGSDLYPCETNGDTECWLNITADSVLVGATSTISANGRGYLGHDNNRSISGAYTVGNTTVGGAQVRDGGSHGGVGGEADQNAVYGNFTNPTSLGAGGGRGSASTSYDGGDGGSAILINATNSVIVDGSIQARGNTPSNGSGGAGGSINISTSFLGGNGTLNASGGNGWNSSSGGGGGSGGRIAIRGYTALGGSFDVATLADNAQAFGGTGYFYGGAGTIFLKPASQAFGSLIVDNNNPPSNKVIENSTPIQVVPEGTITSASEMDSTITDGGANWAPSRYIGTFVDTNAPTMNPVPLAGKALFAIDAHTSNTMTVSGTGDFSTLVSGGNIYRGVLVVDQLTVRRGADVFVDGDVLVQNGSTGAPAGTFQIDGTIEANLLDLSAATAVDVSSGGIEALEIFGNGQADFAFDYMLSGADLIEDTIHAKDLVLDASSTVNANSLNLTGDLLATSSTFNIGDITATGTTSFLSCTGSTVGTIAAGGFLMTGGSMTVDQLVIGGSAELEQGAQLTVVDSTVNVGETFVLRDSNTVLYHADTTTSDVFDLDVTADVLVVGAGSSIDANSRGYRGVTSGLGYTFPNTTTGGAPARHGGSHGGIGSPGHTGGTIPAAYDSIFDPRLPGGGGGDGGTGGDGGGVIGLTAATALVIDGSVFANGGVGSNSSSNDGGGGAGGAIRITTPILTGNGAIQANGGAGGSSHGGGGGGGRIAILGVSVFGNGFTLDTIYNTVTAYGGTGWNSMRGGAGTIYVLESGDSWGTLIIDNADWNSPADSTPLVALPESIIGAIGAVNMQGKSEITDATAGWTDNFYAGTWINPNVDQGGTNRLNDDSILPVDSNTLNVLTVDGDADAVADVGDTYRGTYKFKNLEIRARGRLSTVGDIIVTDGDLHSADSATLDIPTDSTLKANIIDLYSAALAGDGTVTGTVYTD